MIGTTRLSYNGVMLFCTLILLICFYTGILRGRTPTRYQQDNVKVRYPYTKAEGTETLDAGWTLHGTDESRSNQHGTVSNGEEDSHSGSEDLQPVETSNEQQGSSRLNVAVSLSSARTHSDAVQDSQRTNISVSKDGETRCKKVERGKQREDIVVNVQRSM